MNNLYSVAIETVMVVVASSKEEASEIAMETVYSDGTSQDITDVSLILTESDLPLGWDTSTIPFGSDNYPEHSIGEILRMV